MKALMVEFFRDYASIIVFLHVISAFIWVGGMIIIRFAVHPSLQNIQNGSVKLGVTLEIMQRLFRLVMPFIAILVISAVLMAIGLGFKGTALYPIVHVKEAIWTIMTLNFSYMFIKRDKAQTLFDNGDMAGAKNILMPIPKILLPLNIALGIIALYFGITLRGF